MKTTILSIIFTSLLLTFTCQVWATGKRGRNQEQGLTSNTPSKQQKTRGSFSGDSALRPAIYTNHSHDLDSTNSIQTNFSNNNVSFNQSESFGDDTNALGATTSNSSSSQMSKYRVLENGDALGNEDMLPTIFSFLDPGSFSNVPKVCKRWKKVFNLPYTFSTFFLPKNSEEIKAMLSKGVTKTILYRVTNTPNGINRLKKFFLSYFDLPAEERVFGRSDFALVFTKAFKTKAQGPSNYLKQYKSSYAAVWQPYATALAICSALEEPVADKFRFNMTSNMDTLSFDHLLYPFFRTNTKEATYDETEAQRQSKLSKSLFLELSPHLMLKAWKSHNIPHLHLLQSTTVEQLKKNAFAQNALAFRSDLVEEKKTFLAKSAGYYNRLLQLLGDSATSENLKSAASANYNAGLCSDQKNEKKTFFVKAADYGERLLQLLGDEATPQDLRYAATANYNAGLYSDQKNEKKTFLAKAADYGDRLLQLLGDEATPQDLRVAASANYKAGLHSDQRDEQKTFFVKAANYHNRCLQLLGDGATAENLRNAAHANFNAAFNSDLVEEKKTFFAKATGYYNRRLQLLGDGATAHDLKNAATINWHAALNSDLVEEKKEFFVKAAGYYDRLLQLLGDKATPVDIDFRKKIEALQKDLVLI